MLSREKSEILRGEPMEDHVYIFIYICIQYIYMYIHMCCTS